MRDHGLDGFSHGRTWGRCRCCLAMGSGSLDLGGDSHSDAAAHDWALIRAQRRAALAPQLAAVTAQHATGQPMNPSGGRVDDRPAPHGLAPSDKHTPSPDGSHRGQSGSSPTTAPAAAGKGAGTPTGGT